MKKSSLGGVLALALALMTAAPAFAQDGPRQDTQPVRQEDVEEMHTRAADVFLFFGGTSCKLDTEQQLRETYQRYECVPTSFSESWLIVASNSSEQDFELAVQTAIICMKLADDTDFSFGDCIGVE